MSDENFQFSMLPEGVLWTIFNDQTMKLESRTSNLLLET